ncbi:hypothetical protein [Arthrobacter sp. Leaf337]|uniref:hypothetical protein n=1 Tax=Arthrobacter sp. Leaf337 TaxID=1736342 RepID=UPI0012E206BB|nr:hypothetical protein [Arthrobacter sp. Leaf337]
MVRTFRDRCRSSVRPLLLAVVLTGSWLALAAGPANAASDAPNPLGGIGQAAASLVQDIVPYAEPQAVQEPDEPPVQAVHDVPTPAVRTAAIVVDVVDPVLSGTTQVVSDVMDTAAPLLPAAPLVDTVTDSVTGTVDELGSVVDSLASTLPDLHVPTAPLPTEPVSTLPRPKIPPQVPGQNPDTAAPGLLSGTRVPPSEFPSQRAAATSGVEAASSVARVLPAGGAPQLVRSALSSLQFLANTHAVRALAATIGYVVSAGPTPADEPAREGGFRFAGVQNQSGSASGTGSAGAEASGDVDGFWDLLHDAGRCLVPDAALILAASPSFDPGSSPD